MYTLPSETHLAWIAVQQPDVNSWVRTKFTASVQVISRAEWAGKGEPHPIAMNNVGWWTRLGDVSAYGNDHWWTLWAGFPSDDVAADVIAAIRDYALPAMRERMAG